MIKLLTISFLILSSNAFSAPKSIGLSATEVPQDLKGIGITENLGSKIDLSLPVKNEKGEVIQLSQIITGKKPVMLSLVYFSCPGLCNYHLNGVTEALKKMDWKVSDKFDVIALSFDTKETPEVADKKKLNYLKLYGDEATSAGWHFLTADQNTIDKITQTVGFKYKWDEQSQDWAHASAAVVLSPDGTISRYLQGILFEPKDIKLALMEAADGKIGTVAEKLVWFCYRYDPHQSKYTIAATKLMQFGGGIMILILAIVLFPVWFRSRKKQYS